MISERCGYAVLASAVAAATIGLERTLQIQGHDDEFVKHSRKRRVLAKNGVFWKQEY